MAGELHARRHTPMGTMSRRHATASAVTLLAASAAGGHLVYPALLWLLAGRRRPPEPPEPSSWPFLTVLVPAYKEAGIIAAKVDDVGANGYPGELEVLVVADDDETAAAAQATPARVIAPGVRMGKAQAINLGMELAAADIVVLNDANNRLVPGSLAALARHFDDPAIGAVAGEKVEEDAGGEELYWRFESWLKQREWALGTTIGVSGELVGVRRKVWEPVPFDISSDDLWIALDYNDRGHAIAYEPTARSIDPPYGAAGERWERRTRMLAGSLFVFWRKRPLLAPARGVLALEIVGHRLWRSTLGPLSHLALVLLALGHAKRSRLAALFVAGHSVGAAALVWRESGRRLPGPLAGGAQVLYLQVVALGGMLRAARGDRVLQWAKAAR